MHAHSLVNPSWTRASSWTRLAHKVYAHIHALTRDRDTRCAVHVALLYEAVRRKARRTISLLGRVRTLGTMKRVSDT